MSASRLGSPFLGKTNVSIIALIVLALFGLAVMIVTLIYQAIQSNYSSEYRELAEIQQLLGQEMIGVSSAAAKGSLLAARRLEEIRQLYDSTLKVLHEGDPASGLPPIPAEMKSEVETSTVSWHVTRDQLGILINNARIILEVVEFEAEVRNQIPLLTASIEKIISILLESGSRPEVVYVATRQLMLAERFQNSLQQLFASSGRSVSAADQFARDVAAFGQVLNSLKNGDPALGLPRARNPLIIDELRKAADVHAAISNNIDLILESTPVIFETILALEKLEPNVGVMLDGQEELEEVLEETFEENYFLAMGLAMIAGILMITSLVVVGTITVIRTRRSLEDSTEQGRRNQRAILRLLDELTNLADGDLSAHATVSEDITGAIADSVNYAIDQLRSLVATINTTAVNVSEAASGTSTTAQGLAHSSDQQAKEIATASAAISDMATTMERVSKNAAGSADVAMKSVEIASKGADTVRLSIEGMDSIREQIQQTAKRIKRLGESSQEVGDIIGLITDIADQTNILALNAAIQASTAGEAGRGFAVVADEVQRLAERAGAATKRVEALVKTIQADTNEAVSSMEHSTAGVVTGARLAEDAGEALGEIESVSKRLAGLIQNISKEANQQAVSATNIAGSMETIRRITMETSQGTGKTAESIGNLANLSVQLKQSVAGFKLPDDSAGATGQVGVVSFEEDELLSTMMRRDDEFDQIDLGADTLIDTFMGGPGETPADDLDTLNLNAGELVDQFLDVNPGFANELTDLEETNSGEDPHADALVDRFLKLDAGDEMPDDDMLDETIDPQADALVDQFLKQGEEDSFLETQKISRK